MMDKYLGILSGTSLDSIDVASYQIADNHISTIATSKHKLSSNIKSLCQKLRYNEPTTILEIATLDSTIGAVFAIAINEHLQQFSLEHNNFKAIGSHGINVYHNPNGKPGVTVQLGDPNVIAQNTGITTVADFRRRDVAANGQGAPLAPLFHQQLFKSTSQNRCIINIGGITNVSLLNKDDHVIGFDLGPGNCLIDEICTLKFNCDFDKDAKLAKKGHCNDALLDILLDDPYFRLPPPKSTGREYFNQEWLNNKLANINISKHDLLYTLTTLTATIISNFVKSQKVTPEIYLCGGGANNPLIRDIVASTLACEVYTTEKLGVSPDWVESALFAWLAYNTTNANKLDYGKITGARNPSVLGGIFTS